MYQIKMELKYGSSLTKVCLSFLDCMNYMGDIKSEGFDVLSYEIIQGTEQ
jgi:hypothetical protein